MVFDWDPNKAESNFRKHGVDFVDASEVFADLNSIDSFDEFNSADEDRFIIIGMCRGFILHVTYIERGEKTRLISARKATKHEQSSYYSAQSQGL
jgi:uncharacterized protein